MIILPGIALEAGHCAEGCRPWRHHHPFSVEGTTQVVGKTLFDVALPIAPPRPHN
jgi:hypothetical protein